MQDEGDELKLAPGFQTWVLVEILFWGRNPTFIETLLYDHSITHCNKSFLCIGSFIPQVTLKIRHKCRIFPLDVRILRLSEVAYLVQVHTADRADTPEQVPIASKSTFTNLTILTILGCCEMTPLLEKPVGFSVFLLAQTQLALLWPFLSLLLWLCDIVLF